MNKTVYRLFSFFVNVFFVCFCSFGTLLAQESEALSSTVMKLLSSSGRVIPDVEANSFLVVDHPSNLAMIEEYLKMIDVPQQQVLIEARIVEVKLEGEHALGVNWALNKWRLGHDLQAYGVDRLATGNAVQGVWQQLENQTPKFPPISGTNTDPFTLGIFNQNIDVVLQALTSEMDTNIISAPQITTTNNRRAKIDVLKTIPYLREVEKEETGEGADKETTFTYYYTFADEGVTLDVTPLINPDGTITMTLLPQVKEIIQFREVLGPSGIAGSPELPETDVRIANTKVTVQAGQTLVIGGLIREKLTGGVLKVPFLGDVPLLGSLFRTKIDTKEKTELLIFVSPSVITPQVVSRMGRQQREASAHSPIGHYSAEGKDLFAVEYPAEEDVPSQIEFLDKTLDDLIGQRNELRRDMPRE